MKLLWVLGLLSAIVVAVASTVAPKEEAKDQVVAESKRDPRQGSGSSNGESDFDTLDAVKGPGNSGLSGTGGHFPRSLFQDVISNARVRTLNSLAGRVDSHGIFRPGNYGANSGGGSATATDALLSSPHVSLSSYYRPILASSNERQFTTTTPYSTNSVSTLPSRGSLQIGETAASTVSAPSNGYNTGLVGVGSHEASFRNSGPSVSHQLPQQYTSAPLPQQFSPTYNPYHQQVPSYHHPGRMLLQAPFAGQFSPHRPQHYISAATNRPEYGPFNRVAASAQFGGYFNPSGYAPNVYGGGHYAGNGVAFGPTAPGVFYAHQPNIAMRGPSVGYITVPRIGGGAPEGQTVMLPTAATVPYGQQHYATQYGQQYGQQPAAASYAPHFTPYGSVQMSPYHQVSHQPVAYQPQTGYNYGLNRQSAYTVSPLPQSSIPSPYLAGYYSPGVAGEESGASSYETGSPSAQTYRGPHSGYITASASHPAENVKGAKQGHEEYRTYFDQPSGQREQERYSPFNRRKGANGSETRGADQDMIE